MHSCITMQMMLHLCTDECVTTVYACIQLEGLREFLQEHGILDFNFPFRLDFNILLRFDLEASRGKTL